MRAVSPQPFSLALELYTIGPLSHCLPPVLRCDLCRCHRLGVSEGEGSCANSDDELRLMG